MRGESGRVAARVRALLGDSDLLDPDLLSDRFYASPQPGASRQVGALEERVGAPEREVSEQPGSGWARRRMRGWTQRWPVRLDPGRRAAVGVGVGVLVVAIATGAWVLADRPQPVAVAAESSPGSAGTAAGRSAAPSGTTAARSSAAGAAGPPAAPSGPAGVVVVDVAGKVRRPGLYRLPAGSRIDDAVQAAGGALRGTSLTSLNLASKVMDGQQIVVGLAGTAAVGAAGGSGSGSSTGTIGAAGPSSAPVDLNTASSDQLQALPGVGPVLAQHILDWRTAHGSFTSVSQLNNVPGIGEVKFAALRSLVSV